MSSWLDRFVSWALPYTIRRRLQRASGLKLAEGLHVFMVGTGSPLPDAQRQGPCIAIAAAGKLFVVDAGNGAARNMALMGLDLGAIDGLFLTHYHSDHIGGLGEFMLQRWARGARQEPLEVWGPVGVEGVIDGFNQAYRLDSGYRTAHHGEAVAPPSGAGGRARVVPLGASPTASAVVLESDGLKVTMFKVDHAPVEPAVGYRFDYGGRSVLITGDSKACASLDLHAKGVDLLVSEAMQTDIIAMAQAAAAPGQAKSIMGDIASYHLSMEEAGRLAASAGAQKLLLYHVIPPMPARALQGYYLRGVRRHYDGPTAMAEDGMHVHLPLNSTAIRSKNLL